MDKIQEKIKKIQKDFLQQIEKIKDKNSLEIFFNSFLGRKGVLTAIFKEVKSLPQKQRPEVGKLVNEVKKKLEEVFLQKKEDLTKDSGEQKTGEKEYDQTLPGRINPSGTLHPLTLIKQELNDAFRSLGFEIYEGPEISSEAYVFDYLNIPSTHSARESMDTYWLKNNQKLSDRDQLKHLCLRPHLTGGSVRFMQTHKPPFRFVYPGRVFRNESTDAVHEKCFYQYEALIVNEDITFAGGKILVKTILERIFKKEVKIRMRAGFFSFVEPGFEIDMQCLQCGGKGCKSCKHQGWLELMPGGPPHPNVLRAGGIDPEKWQGFYINIGLDRLAMMKYGIDDIRLFHSGDLRFLKQFKY